MSKVTLTDVLRFFPEVELPITLNEDMAHNFSSTNKPLPQAILHSHITVWEGELDEYTEYVPCLRLKTDSSEFHALIYWKAELLSYAYILVTIDQQGNLIDRKPIASMLADSEAIKQSVAHIDEDFIINIMAGINKTNEQYNPAHSQPFAMEIMSDGKIIFSAVEDIY